MSARTFSIGFSLAWPGAGIGMYVYNKIRSGLKLPSYIVNQANIYLFKRKIRFCFVID
jgi:hypothetical protein